MRVFIATDKFKYTFKAQQITDFISKQLAQKGIQTTALPLSDGGEGFIDVINTKLKGQLIGFWTHDPIFRYIYTEALVKNDTVYIECARSCGIDKIPSSQRNPLYTTSLGVGEQIRKFINDGIKNFYIGLGGSATNDIGIGMANALNYRFLDKNCKNLKPIGKNLIKIEKILKPKFNYRQFNFVAVADVKIPLLGKNGAAYTFAVQKGATKNDVEILEKGAQKLTRTIKKQLKIDIGNNPGEGAAGGLAAAIRAFLGGKIIFGTEFIFSLFQIEKYIKNADIVITGEGALDNTSFYGKPVGQIYKIARKYNKETIVICGTAKQNINLHNLKIYPLFNNVNDMQQIKKQTFNRIKLVLDNIFG